MSSWVYLILNRVDTVGLVLVIIGVGGWGLPTEGIPRSPDEVKAYMRDIKQAPGLSVPEWYHEFIDLMFENDNWKNVVFDEFVARRSAFTQIRG